MIDLLTIGDSCIDIYMKIGEQGVNEHSGEICFFHGSKIIVNQIEDSIAGNAINAATGATRLGLKTAVYTELGNDVNGQRIIRELKGYHISTKYCVINENIKTNIHTVIVHGQDRTIFSYHGKRTYKLGKWETPKWIYYTSLGYGFEQFQSELVSYIKENEKIGIAFNPGSIQMKEGLEKMRDILEVSDLLIVNKEEATKLVGQYETGDLHKKLHELGPKLTLITDGKKGSSAYDRENLFEMGTYSDERPIIDKTGAGDAFSSGFVSALFYKKHLKEALKWGAINSGNAIKEIGAIHGLTDLKEMERLVPQI